MPDEAVVEESKPAPIEVIEPGTIFDDPVMQILAEDLKLTKPETIEAAPPKEEVKPDDKPAEQPATEEKAEETKPPATEEKPKDPPTEKVEIKKAKQWDLGDIAKTVTDAVRAAAPPTGTSQVSQGQVGDPQAKAKDPAEDLTGWTPEEIEALELAKYAEKSKPEYAGMASKVRNFRKQLDDYITKASKEDPDRTFDESDTEFQKWIKSNKPAYRPGEDKVLYRSMIQEQAAAQAEQRMQSKFEEVERKLHRVAVKPETEKVTAQFRSTLAEDLASEKEDAHPIVSEIVKAASEGKINDISKKYPLHARAVSSVYGRANELAKTLVDLDTRVEDFDPNNKDHVTVAGLIQNYSDWFSANGGDERVKEGKRFMTRAEYNALSRSNPAEASKYWTFTTDDLLQKMRNDARQRVIMEAKSADELLTAYGVSVQKAPATQPQKTESKPESAKVQHKEEKSSPKVGSTISPGAGKSTPVKPNGILPPEYISALGLPV